MQSLIYSCSHRDFAPKLVTTLLNRLGVTRVGAVKTDVVWQRSNMLLTTDTGDGMIDDGE